MYDWAMLLVELGVAWLLYIIAVLAIGDNVCSIQNAEQWIA